MIYIKNKLKISINLDNFNELICIWKTYWWKQYKKQFVVNFSQVTHD